MTWFTELISSILDKISEKDRTIKFLDKVWRKANINNYNYFKLILFLITLFLIILFPILLTLTILMGIGIFISWSSLWIKFILLFFFLLGMFLVLVFYIFIPSGFLSKEALIRFAIFKIRKSKEINETKKHINNLIRNIGGFYYKEDEIKVLSPFLRRIVSELNIDVSNKDFQEFFDKLGSIIDKRSYSQIKYIILEFNDKLKEKQGYLENIEYVQAVMGVKKETSFFQFLVDLHYKDNHHKFLSRIISSSTNCLDFLNKYSKALVFVIIVTLIIYLLVTDRVKLVNLIESKINTFLP
ncbi:MAG: hypothetical protein Q7S55_03875 [Nanoarchaeota archaeon]|nr:hypothetical protein [Nanoarchaeota archaeon]